MIVFKKLGLWTSDKAIALRELLENSVLQEALLHTHAMRPDLTRQGSIASRLTNAGVVAGYELFLENLVSLTVEESKAPETSIQYASLDDDSKWPSPPPVPTLPQWPDEADVAVTHPDNPTS